MKSTVEPVAAAGRVASHRHDACSGIGSPGPVFALGLAALLLGGCASLSPDGGLGNVASIAKDRLGKDVTWPRRADEADAVAARVAELLAKPLSVDAAVQVALLNNRGLQATYADLGISEAELVQAGRLPNPGFSFSRTRIGDDTRIERTFTVALVALVTMPWRLQIERSRWEQTKLLVANEVLRVAAETRKAYFNAVAATQTAIYMEQVLTAAEAGADLAGRMAKAGNWSKLDQAREQVFKLDAAAQLAKSRQKAAADRERLVRLLGLVGKSPQLMLPERLPDLPEAFVDLAPLEELAGSQRLDLRAGQVATESLARSLGLTRATRFVNALEVGYRRNTETGIPVERGYEFTVEIPLFDWGDARIAKAEATYLQAVDRLADTALAAASEVREAHAAYATAFAVARQYRDQVVPLRKRISAEILLRYNGMLVSVFELLADAREQVASVNASIEALRDFWLAETELQQSVGGKLPPATLVMELALPALIDGKADGSSSDPHSTHRTKGN